MAGRANPRPSGALENEVVASLAAAGGPLTAAEVREQLGGDLAYTTTLTRLYEKQALGRTRLGRAYTDSLIGSQNSRGPG